MCEWFSTLHPTAQALLAGMFTWIVTALGAAVVLFTSQVKQKTLDVTEGFAAGVMIAASYWSLLAPADRNIGRRPVACLVAARGGLSFGRGIPLGARQAATSPASRPAGGGSGGREDGMGAKCSPHSRDHATLTPTTTAFFVERISFRTTAAVPTGLMSSQPAQNAPRIANSAESPSSSAAMVPASTNGASKRRPNGIQEIDR